MLDILVVSDLMWALFAVLTFFLVAADHAFQKTVRGFFYTAIGGCFFLSIYEQLKNILNVYGIFVSEAIDIGILGLLRILVLLFLCYIAMPMSVKQRIFFCIPAIVGCISSFFIPIVGIAVFLLYFIFFVTCLFSNFRNGEITQGPFAMVLIILLIPCCIAEIASNSADAVNVLLCVATGLYYYYLVMSTYKLDALTRLFLRHTLKYELEDLADKEYDMAVIDVDNFKMINDKYGHDKGDEALVTIVDSIKARLVRGCRMYRFGGDEFVIISHRVSTEKLKALLDDTNYYLDSRNLHISYGIVRHMPHVDYTQTLTQADMLMYENKKALKAEGIWDDMTGLYNYKGFLDELDFFRKSVAKDNHAVQLVAIDIEHLSNINLAYGYTEGNEIIAILSRVIKACLRGSDFIGHLGSDEFAVAIEVENNTDPYITEFINRVIEGIDSTYELAGKDYTVSLNFGKSYVMMNSPKSSEDCLNEVLYVKQEDKENRRKTDLSDEDNEYDNQDEECVLDILNHNRLRYAFQPIVSTKDGEIVAYESLMRSASEVMVSPLKILKYAAKNKRMYDVEKYTFNNIFSFVYNSGKIAEDKKIFINSIPGYMLNETDYGVLKERYGRIFDRFVVEITEQREITEDDLVSINTRRAGDGLGLAIDDYGSGCSNTNSLLRYMPDVIKLDRLLITGIDRNAKKQFFVNSIITFARDNDIKTLAEGVETEKELRTLIRLGVDLIQGYFTAKPSYEIIEDISPEVKKIIINERMKSEGGNKKVFTASTSTDLSLVHLAMEDYTRINVSAENIKIIGNPEYTADMYIKIKDGIKCNLHIVDAKINSVDDLPCIDIGNGAELILTIEGNNSISTCGIHVPDDARFTLRGNGNLEIKVKGHRCYGIGSASEEEFGDVILEQSGKLIINTDGDECIGIGGGIYKEGKGITIKAGAIDMTIAGVSAVGVGSFIGDVPISFSDCAFSANCRVNTGTAIGSLFGKQNISFKNFDVNIEGSGSSLSAIGCTGPSGGSIYMGDGSCKVRLSGHIICLIGVASGDASVDIEHVNLSLIGEGDEVIGFGSFDKNSKVNIYESLLDVAINASVPIAIGAKNENLSVLGEASSIKLNGSEYITSNL